MGTPRGSVSGGPWQLVEVSNERARRSWAGMTEEAQLFNIPRTPSTQPSPGLLAQPGHPGFDSWTDFELPAAATADDIGSTAEFVPDRREETRTEDGFDPASFVGEWQDNLGHQILVVPSEAQANGRRRGRGRDGGNREGERRVVYTASLQKPGLPEKKFNITRDPRGRRDWTCGNGTIVREESDSQKIVWKASDGRLSFWERAPPDGPVFFDADPMPAPVLMARSQMDWVQPDGAVYFDPPPDAGGGAAGGGCWHGQPVFFMMAESGAIQGAPLVEWKELRFPMEDDEFAAAQQHQQPPQEQLHGGMEATSSSASPDGGKDAADAAAPVELSEAAAAAAGAELSGASALGLNPSAPAFVPSGALVLPPAAIGAAPHVDDEQAASPHANSPAVASRHGSFSATPGAGTPVRTPLPSPGFGPAPAPRWEVAEPALLQLSESSPDVDVSGSQLRWRVPDDWGKLSRLPKDICITSPMFGIRQAASMQLMFYPNGSKKAEPGQCTVALTRGMSDNAGLKFEFIVNGRSSGPKVCLGRRYLGDYPKPLDDSEENKPKQVVVVMHVLEVLGSD